MGTSSWILAVLFNFGLILVSCEPDVDVQDVELQMLNNLGIKLLPDEEKTVAVSCVARSSVELPCNLTSPLENDQVRLVLWFKNDSAKPIYTYDTRGKSYLSARHWSDDGVLEGRAFFRGDSNPGRLVLDNINPYDQGLYKCRVDFATAPTRISNIVLDVIVPPEKPRIHDENNQEVRLKLGPYKLGDTVTVTCEVLGGRPSPSVTWWRDHHLVDQSFLTDTEYKVTNQLVVPNISRKDLHSIFTCQASNNNVSVPVSTSVKLDITFGPSSIRLLGVKESLSAGQPHEVQCEAAGARPAPRVSWWRDDQEIVKGISKPQTSPDGNVTVSSLWITAEEDDDGDIITCKAGNPDLPNSSIQTSWNLQVNYKPKVQLSFGSQLEASNIKEGNDVYFECKVKSHPRHYKITWKRNGETLFHDVGSGIIISNQSLVVQRVTRSDTGGYTCHVFNSEGEGVSNQVNLAVKYAPVCSSSVTTSPTQQKKVFGAARQELVSIMCEVIANPSENLKFEWIFSKGDEKLDMQQSQIRVNGTQSVLDYVPRTEMDYGNVMCWATNSVGRQEKPCVFHIIPAGKPDPVVNCSISNQTQSSFLVSCLPGFDGGLTQVFGLNVLNDQQSLSILNMTSKVPKFKVVGLQSEKSFTLTVHSSNLRGRSEQVVLQAQTTKHTLPEPDINQAKIGSLKTRLIISPVLGVLIGVGGAIILVSITLFAIMCFRVKYEKFSRRLFGRPEGDAADKDLQDDLYVDLTDNSPDLIPNDEYHVSDQIFARIPGSSSKSCARVTDERKYSTLQSQHFKNEADYETIKQIHSNITRIGKPNKEYSQMTMPNRSRHGHRGVYTPMASDNDGVIYAKVDKVKKMRQRHGKELNIFNTSSESSVHDHDGDESGITVETPLVTSDDGRSSSNSDESKYNKMNTISYEDRESRV